MAAALSSVAAALRRALDPHLADPMDMQTEEGASQATAAGTQSTQAALAELAGHAPPGGTRSSSA
eukprot:3016065-Karenia_brevis.AAC.1